MFGDEDKCILAKGPYKVIVRYPDNCKFLMNSYVKSGFCYEKYLMLDKHAEAVPTSEERVEPKVTYLVVIRNVYKNQVVFYPKGTFFMTLENDTWNDPAPFDDYSVLSAKRCCNRSFGSYPAKYTSKVVYPKLSLRVEGAICLNDEFYVLTQVIFGDDVEPQNNTWKLKDIKSIVPKNDLEKEVLKCLAIVTKKEENNAN